MESLMELQEIATAYDDSFEECCKEEGFDVVLFVEKMIGWLECWLISEEDREEWCRWLTKTSVQKHYKLYSI